MNCKTCSHSLSVNDKFCPNCGAKIVDNRLSIKGTWEEFVGPFFSWDNNFWRTFFGLFINPKDVLTAYISGARKKYFQPFSYLVVYTTIAIFFYKFFPLNFENFTNGFNQGYTKSSSENPFLNHTSFESVLYGYYNFIMVAMIPFISIITYFVFKKHHHNFAEHTVFNSFLQANLGYISMILQILLIKILDFSVGFYSGLNFLASYFYSIFIFTKLYNLNLKQIIVATLKFFVYLLALYLLIMLFVIPITIIFTKLA